MAIQRPHQKASREPRSAGEPNPSVKSRDSAQSDAEARASRRVADTAALAAVGQDIGVQGSQNTEKFQRILSAAISVFAEHGYFNSRVSEIAQRADVADGTVYLYFKNKEQILMAAIDFAFSSFMEQAKTELAAMTDPRQQLRRLATLHLERMEANRGMAMVLQTELRQSAKFLAEFSHRHLHAYFDLVREIVRKAQQSGLFRPEVSDKVAANAFFGALDSTVTSWLLSHKGFPLAANADPLCDLFFHGMGVLAGGSPRAKNIGEALP